MLFLSMLISPWGSMRIMSQIANAISSQTDKTEIMTLCLRSYDICISFPKPFSIAGFHTNIPLSLVAIIHYRLHSYQIRASYQGVWQQR